MRISRNELMPASEGITLFPDLRGGALVCPEPSLSTIVAILSWFELVCKRGNIDDDATKPVRDKTLASTTGN